MKRILILVFLAPLVALAQPLPPPAASQTEVNAGANGYKYVTPKTLNGYSGNLTGYSTAAISNQVGGMLLGGSNVVFSGVSAASFAGNGAGLTNVTASKVLSYATNGNTTSIDVEGVLSGSVQYYVRIGDKGAPVGNPGISTTTWISQDPGGEIATLNGLGVDLSSMYSMGIDVPYGLVMGGGNYPLTHFAELGTAPYDWMPTNSDYPLGWPDLQYTASYGEFGGNLTLANMNAGNATPQFQLDAMGASGHGTNTVLERYGFLALPSGMLVGVVSNALSSPAFYPALRVMPDRTVAVDTSVCGNGLGLTNVASTNVMSYVVDPTHLVVSGFGSSVLPLVNGGDGSSRIDATGANGNYTNITPYRWDGPNGYGISVDTVDGFVLLTNSAYNDVANVTAVAIAANFYITNTDGFYQSDGVTKDGSYVYANKGTPMATVVSAGGNTTNYIGGDNVVLLGKGALDLSGSTNLPGSVIQTNSISTNSIDPYMWESVQAARLGFNTTNLFRYATSNTFYAIKNNLPITVLMNGNGWVSESTGGQFDYVISALTNLYGLRGFYSPPVTLVALPGGGAYVPISCSGSQTYNGPTTTWWAPYAVINGNSVGFRTQIDPSNSRYAGFAANVFEVDYIKTAGGGTFTVATNGGGSAWGIVTTLNGNNSTTLSASFRWTNVNGTLNPYIIGITNTAAVSNCFAAFGFINTNVAGGVEIAMQTQQATSAQAFEACPDSAKAPIYKGWNPTLILDIWGNTANDTYYPNIVYWYKTNTPHADAVLNTQFWVNYPTAPVTSDSVEFACAKTNNYSFFSGIGSVDIPGLYQRGGFSTDGGHLTRYGQIVYGELLWDWLGLNQWHY